MKEKSLAKYIGKVVKVTKENETFIASILKVGNGDKLCSGFVTFGHPMNNGIITCGELSTRTICVQSVCGISKTEFEDWKRLYKEFYEESMQIKGWACTEDLEHLKFVQSRKKLQNCDLSR